MLVIRTSPLLAAKSPGLQKTPGRPQRRRHNSIVPLIVHLPADDAGMEAPRPGEKPEEHKALWLHKRLLQNNNFQKNEIDIPQSELHPTCYPVYHTV